MLAAMPLRGLPLALTVSLAVAAIVTWPLVVDPLGGAVGHPGNDVWNHLWGYHWVASTLRAGELPLRTSLMAFPQGGRLFFIDTFGALLTLPVQWGAGTVAAYNAAVFGAFVAAGLAAWAFARHVVGWSHGPGPVADTAAIVAAVAWASSAHLIAQAYNGITETLLAGTFPLAVLAVMRLLERPGWRRALVAATAMAVCVAANGYQGIFAAIGSVLVLIGWVPTRVDRVDWSRVPTAAGLAAVVAVGAVAPVLLRFSASLEGDDAMVRRDPEFVWDSLVEHNITDVLSGFRPGRVYSPDLSATTGEHLLIVTYLGWALLLLAAVGLWRMRRWRDRLPWLLWIGTFYLLMLGPYLHVAGAYVTVADRQVPLPFLALFDAVPLFQRVSHPFRLVMPVQLGLAVLAARALADAPAWLRAAAPALVLAESLLASPAPWPLPRADTEIPAYTAVLRDDPVPGAVLDLPIGVPNLERAVYLYWQSAHGRPSPYSLNEPVPALLARSPLTQAVLVAEGSRIDRLPPVLPQLDLVVAGRALAAQGVRYVVVHEPLYPPDRREQVLTLLRAALGPETLATDERRIWRLPDPRRATVSLDTPALSVD
jgi:hypothetical protein